MNKPKPCKLCSKKRFANTSWCYSHYRKMEKEKREARALKKKLRKEGSKKFSESLRKKLHKKAWKLMSEWIRRKDSNADGYNYCYTCDKPIHWKEAHAGHFKHDRLDFDERNLKIQCPKCNKYYSGRLDVYASNLIRDYGLEQFRELEKDANSYRKYQIEELHEIIESLKLKLKLYDRN